MLGEAEYGGAPGSAADGERSPIDASIVAGRRYAIASVAGTPVTKRRFPEPGLELISNAMSSGFVRSRS